MPSKKASTETVRTLEVASDKALAAATVLGERVAQVEKAVIQLNHFTESVEELKLAEWKAEVSTDLRWVKLLMGGSVIAGLGQLILTAIRGG